MIASPENDINCTTKSPTFSVILEMVGFVFICICALGIIGFLFVYMIHVSVSTALGLNRWPL